MSGRRDRSRSPQRGGFNGRDRYKILLKNLPYEVNWQKLKVSFYLKLYCKNNLEKTLETPEGSFSSPF